jgi:hypothetical protein
MKALKALCTVAVLALSLSVPTYAGEVSTPGLNAPDPATPIVTAPTLEQTTTTNLASTSSTDAETLKLLNLLLAIISIY